jgi:hypothetical protein
VEKIYSHKIFKFLSGYFFLSSIALLGSSFSYWMWFAYSSLVPLLIFLFLFALFPICGVTAMFLQNKFSVRYGYIIVLPTIAGLYIWFQGLFIFIDIAIKESPELLLTVPALVFGFLFLLPYFYIGSTIFRYTSQRKVSITLSAAALLISTALILGSYLSQHWSTYSEVNCGYKIDYSPKLSVGGFGSNRGCKTMTFDRAPGGHSDFVRIGPTKSQLRHSLKSKSYSVNLNAQNRSVVFQCVYSSEEMLTICNQMRKTFKSL